MEGVQANLQKKYSVDDIPNEILQEQVFLHLPLRDLKSCYLVCRRFAACLDQRGFWIQKCVLDSTFSQNLLRFLGENDDIRKLYLKRPYERNLIKNCDASLDLMYWKMPECKWGRQVECGGIDPRSQRITEGPVWCWETSGSCFKYQIIDLLDEGCSEHVLDVVRPSIRVSECYSRDGFNQVRYILKVALLTENNELFWKQKTLPENCLYVFKRVLEVNRNWQQTEHVFNVYPAGVRYIGYFHKGRPTELGRPGSIRITYSSVAFDFSHTALP